MWIDRGKEFYNQTFLLYLNEQNFQIFSTNSYLKTVFVERFNRTLLDLNKEPMYIEGKGNWLNHLDAALQKYNNRVHGTTKMTPFEMSFYAASQSAIPNLIPTSKFSKFPKFQVGDFVRVLDKRSVYSKGYTTNWNRELYKIHKIISTNPETYTLEDESNETF